MKRKIWKRLIAVGCAVSLFIAQPGVTVLANEEMVDNVVSETDIDSVDFSVVEKSEENTESDPSISVSAAETEEVTEEDTEEVTEEDTEEVTEEDIDSASSISMSVSDTEKDEKDIEIVNLPIDNDVEENTDISTALVVPDETITDELVGENGYPYNVGPGVFTIDKWGFYQCECTSYCAFKLNNTNNVYFHNTLSHGNKWGNANHWDDFARANGIQVNNTPAVGAIAYWDSGATGHVAWVSAVNGSDVTIEEYNYGYVIINGDYYGSHKYNNRVINSSNPSGYIHIKDINSVVSVSFTPWSNDSYTYVRETDASIGQEINVSGGTCTSTGMYLYDSNGTYLAQGSNSSYTLARVYFQVNAEMGYTLNAGTTYKYKFYAIVNGQEYWSDMYSFTTPPPAVTNINNCSVALSTTSFTYNGSAKKPSVTVKNGATTLTADTDYYVSYSNNVNAGTATVNVTGAGNYTGTITKTFTITKATPILTFASASLSKKTGAAAFTNVLTTKTDGAVTFTSSNTSVATVNSTSGKVMVKGAGTATITATAAEGRNYKSKKTSYTLVVLGISIENASVSGVSLSYGYTGKAYTPAITVKVNDVTLTKNTDYSVKYENNVKPGTAKITIIGKGKYYGTRIKTFKIVNCVSALISGKTYLMIPKNNASTAVCAMTGGMVNNTKVYITNRSNSEAMKWKAIQNADGTWKFINVKSELVLAVSKNSPSVGAGTVLHDQTSRRAQNWVIEKKSDNAFSIANAVTGYSIAMSDASAVKGTTLSMAEPVRSGLQRYYFVATSAVDTSYDGTYTIRASKNKNFVIDIAGGSKDAGANVQLYTYNGTMAQKFTAMYSGGGYYRLENVRSGLVLSVQGNTNTNGANVIQSQWAAQSGQRWKFTKNANGTVTLTNALGTVLHLRQNNTSNGANIAAKVSSTTTAQNWYLN